MVYRKNPLAHDTLRQLATARMSGRHSGLAATDLSLQQVQHLLEELEIYQIELELQNEHLNAARTQLERALNESMALYDFSPVGNVMLDAAGAISKLNLAAAQLLGTERARLIGNRLGVYVAEAHRPQFNAVLACAKAEHETQKAELTLQVDGCAPMPVQVKVIWNGAGQVWQIALVDMSERRQMEEQLRASEERLTLALSAVGEGVWDWQVSSGEVVVSDDYFNLLGFALGDKGKQVSEYLERVHPEDKPQLMKKLQDCVTGKADRYQNEQRMQVNDGRWKWVLSRGAVVQRSTDGQALRVIGTLVDITQKKDAEAACQMCWVASVAKSLPCCCPIPRMKAAWRWRTGSLARYAPTRWCKATSAWLIP
jgi:PAS domain S-box-containing protein